MSSSTPSDDRRDAVDTRNDIRAETASHLRTLYTIGAGISCAVAMARVLTNANEFSAPQPTLAALLLLVAFVATLIPFFHGAMRHMHQSWSESVAPTVGLMMFDFVILFVQTLLFFVLADLTRDPQWFAFTLAILLMVDVAWLFFRRRWRSSGDSGTKWTTVNVRAILALGGLAGASLLFDIPGTLLALLVAVTAVVRTVYDYRNSRSFYFGEHAEN